LLIEPIRRFFQLRLRRIPSALCFVAIAMQIGLPILHGPHVASLRIAATAACDAPTIAAAAAHADDEAAHDSATCPQCRLASQLRSLSPLSAIASAPAVSADWLAAGATPVLLSHAERESGAPRAPPFLA
jgi:hypothetical protein